MACQCPQKIDSRHRRRPDVQSIPDKRLCQSRRLRRSCSVHVRIKFRVEEYREEPVKEADQAVSNHTEEQIVRLPFLQFHDETVEVNARR